MAPVVLLAADALAVLEHQPLQLVPRPRVGDHHRRLGREELHQVAVAVREPAATHVDDRGQPEEGWRLVTGLTCRLIALAVHARPELRRTASGGVAGEIAAAAADLCADLVVLGSRGRSDRGGLVPGSVGSGVVERVSCPVLLVRAGRRASGRRQRILVAVAGDEDPAELVATSAAVAGPDAQVLVLHPPAPDDRDPQLATPTQVVERLVTGLRQYGVRARRHLLAGAPATAQEVTRTALGYGADLIPHGLATASGPGGAAVGHRVARAGRPWRPAVVSRAWGAFRPSPGSAGWVIVSRETVEMLDTLATPTAVVPVWMVRLEVEHTPAGHPGADEDRLEAMTELMARTQDVRSASVVPLDRGAGLAAAVSLAAADATAALERARALVACGARYAGLGAVAVRRPRVAREPGA